MWTHSYDQICSSRPDQEQRPVMQNQLVEAFVLGNTAILTNVCVLPLYPSMVAYLAADSGRARGWSGVLGGLVLAGVLTMMLAVGAGLYPLPQTVSSLPPWPLPPGHVTVTPRPVAPLPLRAPFSR